MIAPMASAELEPGQAGKVGQKVTGSALEICQEARIGFLRR